MMPICTALGEGKLLSGVSNRLRMQVRQLLSDVTAIRLTAHWSSVNDRRPWAYGRASICVASSACRVYRRTQVCTR